MFWFLIALIGYICFAVIFILDKIIVSEKLSKPVVYTFYSTIFMFAALLAWPFAQFALLSGFDWLWALLSGLSFGFGLWTLFNALKNDETSHISPFNGAFVTIFVYFLSNLFLGENLSQFKQAGVIILVFAALLLSFQKTKNKKSFSLGFLWAIISGLFFAISHVSAKYLYDIYPFLVALIWSKAFVGLIGLVTLFFPSVRQSFKKQENVEKTKNKNAFSLIIFDKLLSIVAVICIQYAISIGSVTIVNALIGVQYVLMFVFILILSKFAPKLFNEYFTKKELAIQTIAIILVIIGTAFFVF
ncbi:MAG: DMT family transporter [Candidatus Magasanikbacteria bacterium]